MKYSIRSWFWRVLSFVRNATHITRVRPRTVWSLTRLRLPVFERFEPRVLMDASQFQSTVVLHNVEQPCDVNGNGILEPADALIVVNRLNSQVADQPSEPAADANANSGNGQLQPPATGSGDYYMDVDANQVVNEHDLAMVISQINGQQALDASADTASPVAPQSGIVGPQQVSLASAVQLGVQSPGNSSSNLDQANNSSLGSSDQSESTSPSTTIIDGQLTIPAAQIRG